MESLQERLTRRVSQIGIDPHEIHNIRISIMFGKEYNDKILRFCIYNSFKRLGKLIDTRMIRAHNKYD